MQNESQNTKTNEVQATIEAQQQLQDQLQQLLEENKRLKEHNDHLTECNKSIRECYKLVIELDDDLKHKLECYKNGKKPTCASAVELLHIHQGKIPRPNYLLPDNWHLQLLN
jgi:DNA repair ATPase RecN